MELKFLPQLEKEFYINIVANLGRKWKVGSKKNITHTYKGQVGKACASSCV
jgi:hypothetical protein